MISVGLYWVEELLDCCEVWREGCCLLVDDACDYCGNKEDGDHGVLVVMIVCYGWLSIRSYLILCVNAATQHWFERTNDDPHWKRVSIIESDSPKRTTTVCQCTAMLQHSRL